MRKKLLNKTLRIYLWFSLIILIISAPVFYFLIEKLYIDDADEALLLNKKEFVKYSIPAMKTSDITVWNKVNRDIKVEEPLFNLQRDSIFYHSYLDSLVNENEPYRVLMAPVTIDGKTYNLNARINLIESEDLITNIAMLFLIMLSLLLTGLFFITKRLSNRLWEPFYLTLKQIEEFEIDKNTRPHFSETSIEEFQRLNTAINYLIERNMVIYKSQQEFIENAAHELQTPLAVFQAKLDTLMQQPDLSPGQAEIVLKLTESAARLNRLNKNLLLLSKIDNDHYADKVWVSIKKIVEKHIDFFKEQAEERKILIDVTFDNDFSIATNPALTDVLVSNLLLNAIRHNVENGSVKIAFRDSVLSISNTGNSTAVPSERLFQRFFHSNPSVKGNGIGLAIVKKIADLNKWAVDYSFQGNQHTFIVTF